MDNLMKIIDKSMVFIIDIIVIAFIWYCKKNGFEVDTNTMTIVLTILGGISAHKIVKQLKKKEDDVSSKS